jgi:hypothetical protein
VKKGLLIFILSALVVHAGVEFVGVSLSSGGDLFVVANSESRTMSGWLSVGDTFEGTHVVSFDKGTGLLTVTRGGETLHLALRESKVVEGDMAGALHSRLMGMQFYAKRAGTYDTIIRVTTELKNGKWIYRCKEVWLAPENGIQVGAEIDGSKIAAVFGEREPTDVMLGYVKYPNLLGITATINSGDMWFGTISSDEVRHILAPSKTNQSSDTTLSPGTGRAGMNGVSVRQEP